MKSFQNRVFTPPSGLNFKQVIKHIICEQVKYLFNCVEDVVKVVGCRYTSEQVFLIIKTLFGDISIHLSQRFPVPLAKCPVKSRTVSRSSKMMTSRPLSTTLGLNYLRSSLTSALKVQIYSSFEEEEEGTAGNRQGDYEEI